MPLRRLPSLTALRAFEAAARLGSFKQAAQDLNVTPGAVSQQIRLLEDDLGVALFVREARKVSLTPSGLKLAPEISESFLRMRQALDRVSQREDPGLRINASAAMITKFLLPRLPRFSAEYPDTPILIETEFDLNEMLADGPDVTIRVTRTPPQTVMARRLFNESLLPVASPGLVESAGLTETRDILRVPLLPDGGLPVFPDTPTWDDWFARAGLTRPEPSASMRFEKRSADYAVDMAISGMGVMLCRASLCHAALTNGQLVCPFGPVLTTDVGVYLLSRHDRKSEPHVRAFIDWLQAECGLLATLPSLHGAH